MIVKEAKFRHPFRRGLVSMVEGRGNFADVYHADVPGTIVKLYERIYDHATGEKVKNYSFEQFYYNVVGVTRTLQDPRLGLSPFLPRHVPVWQEEFDGNKGYMVSEEIIGQSLHSGWYHNDDVARQLDDLVAVCLRVPQQVDHPDNNHIIMPDIFYYREHTPPVVVRIRNLVVGRRRSDPPEIPARVFLIDLHPAFIRRKTYSLRDERVLIGEGIYNLSQSGYNFPKAQAAKDEYLNFLQKHWG